MHEKTQQTNRDSVQEEQVDTTDTQLSRVSGNTNEARAISVRTRPMYCLNQYGRIYHIPMFVPPSYWREW